MEELKHLGKAGSEFSVRVSPKASRNLIKVESAPFLIRVYVTVVPESGKATASVIKLLAKAIGIAKTDLVLVRGAKDRVKTFCVRG